MKKLILTALIVINSLLGANSASYTTVSNDIMSSTTWSGTVYVSKIVSIKSGAKVTVDPGTVIKLGHGANLLAPGMPDGYEDNELRLNGTIASPIRITSVDDDSVGETISESDGNPEAGDWGCVWLWTDTMSVKNTKIYYGGGVSSNYYHAALMISADSCLIENTLVSQSDYNGISFTKNGTLDNCTVSNCRVNGVTTSIKEIDSLCFYNSTFKNNGYNGISATNYAGDVRVNNCVFENNEGDGLYISGSNSSIGKDSTAVCYINNCSFNNNEDKAVYINNMTVNTSFKGNTMDKNGINAFYLNSLRNTAPAHFFANEGIPFVTGSSLGHTNLTIHEGTIVKLMDGGISIPETGSLYINGTVSKPVIFTSIADDNIAGDTNNDTLRTAPTKESAISCSGELHVTNTKFHYSSISASTSKKTNTRTIEYSHLENDCNVFGAIDFDSCTFKNNTTALRTSYDTCYVNRCVFENNDLALNNDYGLVLRDCLFENNKIGISISGNYADCGKNNTDSTGNNTFTNNLEYDIKNTEEEVVYAIGNTFDSTDSISIDKKLYDDNEDSHVGEIIFRQPTGGCRPLGKPDFTKTESLVCSNNNRSDFIVNNKFTDRKVHAVLIPSSAGTATTYDTSSLYRNNIYIRWDDAFVGNAKLVAYFSNGTCVGENSDSMSIERVATPPVPVITQDKDTLFSTTAGQYLWYIRNPFEDPIAGATNQTYTVSDYTAQYLVEITDANGCTSSSDLFQPCVDFPALPKPIGSGPDKECQDVGLSLYKINNTSTNSLTWVMTPSNAGTLTKLTDSTCSVSWSKYYIGEVKLYAYLDNGSCQSKNSDTLVIERVAKPTKPVITQTEGLMTSTSATSYQWYTRVGSSTSGYLEPITGATEQTLMATDNQSYAVIVSNIKDCDIASDDYTSLPKLTKPVGTTELCSSIENTTYSTTGDNTDAYLYWKIEPMEAAQYNVDQSNKTSTMLWNKDYVGEVKLYVYLDHKNNTNTGIASYTLSINRIALPAKPAIQEKGDLLISSNAAQYQWYKKTNGALSLITGATEHSYPVTENGIYAVEVSSTANCSAYSDEFQFTYTGINEIDKNRFNVYPNPSTGEFTVELKEANAASIKIYDSMGNTIYSKLTNDKINQVKLDAIPGLYFININSTNSKNIILK